MTRAYLTVRSGNRKTGQISVSKTSAGTCPDSCSFKHNGCYAENHWTVKDWRRLNDGQKGQDWQAFCKAVKTSATDLWRHNEAGDLPGDRDVIDANMLRMLVEANSGKNGFTYTHKPTNRIATARMNAARMTQGLAPLSDAQCQRLVLDNRAAIADAVLRGLTINVSHDSISELDAGVAGVLPSVVVLPLDAPAVQVTPRGHKVVVCPAQTKEKVTCESCKLCSRADRKVVIGFRAHGSHAKKISLRVVQ